MPHPLFRMVLLDVMIDLLGPLEEWPTYILQNLFLHRPSPSYPHRLRIVIAFMYGNTIPLEMAHDFYIACSGLTGAAARFAVDQTEEWYIQWHRSKHRRHIAEYYNMLFKKHYWLNGSLLNQQELSLPEITSMKFGIDETTQPLQIRRRIEVMRTTKC